MSAGIDLNSINTNTSNSVFSMDRVKSNLGNRKVQLLIGAATLIGGALILGVSLGTGSLSSEALTGMAAAAGSVAFVGAGILVHGLFRAPANSSSLQGRTQLPDLGLDIAQADSTASHSAPQGLGSSATETQKAVDQQAQSEATTKKQLERVGSEARADSELSDPVTFPPLEQGDSEKPSSESVKPPVVVATSKKGSWKNTALMIGAGVVVVGLGYAAYTNGLFSFGNKPAQPVPEQPFAGQTPGSGTSTASASGFPTIKLTELERPLPVDSFAGQYPASGTTLAGLNMPANPQLFKIQPMCSPKAPAPHPWASPIAQPMSSLKDAPTGLIVHPMSSFTGRSGAPNIETPSTLIPPNFFGGTPNKPPAALKAPALTSLSEVMPKPKSGNINLETGTIRQTKIDPSKITLIPNFRN